MERGTKSIHIPKNSLPLLPLVTDIFLCHRKILPCSPRDASVKQIDEKSILQLLEQPGTNQNYSDTKEYTFRYFAHPWFETNNWADVNNKIFFRTEAKRGIVPLRVFRNTLTAKNWVFLHRSSLVVNWSQVSIVCRDLELKIQ